MSNSLNYSDFILSSEHIQDKRKVEYDLNTKRQELIKKYVTSNGLVELQSDYLGMDSYYYDRKNRIMYKVCNICDWSKNVNPVFEISNDQHILQLNSLI